MIVNFPLVFPFCVIFRAYHLDHHKFQGQDGIDTDLPSHIECRFVTGPVTKTIWASGQILAYAIRPICVRPLRPNYLVYVNYATQLAYNLAVYSAWGWGPLKFSFLCVLLAGSLHPLAGHFISEHYVFPHLSETQETYSYYGSLNRLAWNVGYHNEHHDFPFVPWSRLPLLNRIAHEFYDDLAVCESWTLVLWDYIWRREVGPFNRVKRKPRKDL